jgi:3-mercaptopyruvate sulfurtransferase SseA
MRLFLSLSAGVVLAATLLLAGCNSKEMKGNAASGGGSNSGQPVTTASSTPIVPNDDVRRVTTVELRDALDKGTAIVIDTRPAESYKQNHIKGSINIPVDQVADRISELPRDKMIVAYCS